MTAVSTVPAAPPCVPWCHTNHDAEGGWDMLSHAARGVEATKQCRRVFGRAGMIDGAVVTLERYACFHDGYEGLEVDPAHLRIETDDAMNLVEAVALAALLREAVAFIHAYQ